MLVAQFSAMRVCARVLKLESLMDMKMNLKEKYYKHLSFKWMKFKCVTIENISNFSWQIQYYEIINRVQGLYGKISDQGLESTDWVQQSSNKKDRVLIFLQTDWASKIIKLFIIWLFFLLVIYPMPLSKEIIGNIQQFLESFENV